MRRMTMTTILATVVALLFITEVQAQARIGTVDVQRVRKENTEFKAALKEIDDMVADFERRRDQKQLELQDLADELQSVQEQNLAPSVNRVRGDLQSKSQEFQTFIQETFGEEGIIETKSAELLEPIYAKLADAAKAVAKAQTLDLILDLEQINPLFVSDALDFTDEILAEMAKLR